MLGGFFGGMAAFAAAWLFGATMGLVPVLSWSALFLIVFGLVGAIRHKARWYVAPLGLLGLVGAQIIQPLLQALINYLGSVSVWDVAAFWAALVGAGTFAMGQIPLHGVRIWRWCNGQTMQEVKIGATTQAADFMAYEERVDYLWQTLMATLGRVIVLYVDIGFALVGAAIAWGWNGFLGLVLFFLFISTIGAIARGLVMLVSGFAVSMGLMMPLATLWAIWAKVPSSAVPPPLE
jgi:hypothetical protein